MQPKARRPQSELFGARLSELLNPEHPDTDKIMISYPEPFSFDSRLA